MIKFTTQQKLLPRALMVEELFDSTTRALSQKDENASGQRDGP